MCQILEPIAKKKKNWRWVSYSSITTRAVPHIAFFFFFFFSWKTGVLLRGTSFCACYLLLFELLGSCQMLACPSATQGTKNAQRGPVPSLELSYRKFRFLPGYKLDKNWCVLLSSGSMCWGRWLKSVFLFLYRSDGISAVLLGSSKFWYMHCYVHFLLCHE